PPSSPPSTGPAPSSSSHATLARRPPPNAKASTSSAPNEARPAGHGGNVGRARASWSVRSDAHPEGPEKAGRGAAGVERTRSRQPAAGTARPDGAQPPRGSEPGERGPVNPSPPPPPLP